jgi:hypothetical protein
VAVLIALADRLTEHADGIVNIAAITSSAS